MNRAQCEAMAQKMRDHVEILDRRAGMRFMSVEDKAAHRVLCALAAGYDAAAEVASSGCHCALDPEQ